MDRATLIQKAAAEIREMTIAHMVKEAAARGFAVTAAEVDAAVRAGGNARARFVEYAKSASGCYAAKMANPSLSVDAAIATYRAKAGF